jgi:2-polyprenyl-3-methyl-5-hydroxy-6-metoxy-1,4-benzoquinol methylase
VSNAELHWNRLHGDQEVEVPSRGDWFFDVLEDALEHFGGDVTNSRLLDLGCGLGAASLFFADRGASVVSVDTSEVAINRLRAYCMEQGIPNVTPLQKSAEEIADIGTFDFIFGSFILHHIEPFEEFVPALRAALRHGGRAFFFENNSRNPILMWARKYLAGKLWVPKYGDEEESPLAPDEVTSLSENFHVEVIYKELYFFRLLPAYVTRGKGHRLFRQLDLLFYRVPRFRQHSYRQYVSLS